MASTRQKLIKDLDNVFSRFVRMRASDESGFAECFTCGKTARWKEMDAGHFMGRSAYSTRWDEQNVQIQCKRCNIFRHGEQYKFSLALDRQYGEGTSETLFRLSKQTRKFGTADLRLLIKEYKAKVEDLSRDKGLE